MNIYDLRKLVERGIMTRKHGVYRIHDRDISMGEIKKTIMRGEITEIRMSPEYDAPSYTIDYKSLRVAVTPEDGRLYLVTVHRNRRWKRRQRDGSN